MHLHWFLSCLHQYWFWYGLHLHRRCHSRLEHSRRGQQHRLLCHRNSTSEHVFERRGRLRLERVYISRGRGFWDFRMDGRGVHTAAAKRIPKTRVPFRIRWPERVPAHRAPARHRTDAGGGVRRARQHLESVPLMRKQCPRRT